MVKGRKDKLGIERRGQVLGAWRSLFSFPSIFFISLILLPSHLPKKGNGEEEREERGKEEI